MRAGVQHRGRQSDCIAEKKGNTTVRLLREEYGQEFLRGWQDNAKLSAVRRETDMSLIELVRQYRRGKM